MSLFRFSIAAAGALCLCAATLAAQDDSEGNSQNLGQINVTGNVESDPLTKKVGETKKSAKQLTKEQVSDSRDMVRHETGVSVVESGRFGASGYSIRGVDENRVDISIDGLRQAETLSSQGFKDLFEGYGNFNNTRNGVEVENVRQVDITKGADSVKRGSGALGGSVAFETKDARDYLTEKDWYYGFKRGYQSADRQNWQSHAAAVRFKWFDLLAIHTDREGHELKNWGYKKYDPTVIRKVREKPDPYRIYKKSTLVKFGFQPTDTDRFSLGYDKSNIKSEGIDWSNQFALYNTQTPWGALTNDIRHTNDRSERKNYSFTYENFDETPLWDSLKFSYNKQHIKLKARTDEYCEGDNCAGISNPAGLHLENGKLVDKYGGELKQGLKWGFMPIVTDSRGE
ncbi:TonB-dependent receptor plug domain-containing protein, partial [uncultured Campylobacter sp.]|uniref:TonB-dependent receptor plug domain-containing protein n=1 Tax=uncultured Campylobacter sp. TaxID=218934 RepID=UPI002619F109